MFRKCGICNGENNCVDRCICLCRVGKPQNWNAPFFINPEEVLISDYGNKTKVYYAIVAFKDFNNNFNQSGIGYIPKNQQLYQSLKKAGYKIIFKPVLEYRN